MPRAVCTGSGACGCSTPFFPGVPCWRSPARLALCGPILDCHVTQRTPSLLLRPSSGTTAPSTRTSTCVLRRTHAACSPPPAPQRTLCASTARSRCARSLLCVRRAVLTHNGFMWPRARESVEGKRARAVHVRPQQLPLASLTMHIGRGAGSCALRILCATLPAWQGSPPARIRTSTHASTAPLLPSHLTPHLHPRPHARRGRPWTMTGGRPQRPCSCWRASSCLGRSGWRWRSTCGASCRCVVPCSKGPPAGAGVCAGAALAAAEVEAVLAEREQRQSMP